MSLKLLLGPFHHLMRIFDFPYRILTKKGLDLEIVKIICLTLQFSFSFLISSCKSCFNSPLRRRNPFFFAQAAISQRDVLKTLSHSRN